jgi:hypothetical protein
MKFGCIEYTALLKIFSGFPNKQNQLILSIEICGLKNDRE